MQDANDLRDFKNPGGSFYLNPSQKVMLRWDALLHLKSQRETQKSPFLAWNKCVPPLAHKIPNFEDDVWANFLYDEYGKRYAMINPDSITGQTYYQIQVKGRLDTAWADWFDHFEIAYHEGYTMLTGPVFDQSALLGLLLKLHDLGLTVIAVNPIKTPEQ